MNEDEVAGRDTTDATTVDFFSTAGRNKEEEEDEEEEEEEEDGCFAMFVDFT